MIQIMFVLYFERGCYIRYEFSNKNDTAGYFGCLGLCDSLSNSFEEILQCEYLSFFNP